MFSSQCGKVVDGMAYVIAEPCIDVKDRACVDECPVDCIYEGGRMLYIQPDECVDCDACVPVCPVTAIFPADDTPNEWKQFVDVNAAFFGDGVSGLGSPGGAAQVGAVAADHPTVAGWEAI
jgi:ferredoxin